MFFKFEVKFEMETMYFHGVFQCYNVFEHVIIFYYLFIFIFQLGYN